MSSSSESDGEEVSNQNYINNRKRRSKFLRTTIPSKKQCTQCMGINEGASTSSAGQSNEAHEVYFNNYYNNFEQTSCIWYIVIDLTFHSTITARDLQNTTHL